MAKKEQREDNRRANLQQKKEREFRAACKKLGPYATAELSLLVIALLLFFTNWLEIYNTDIPGIEIGVSGFSTAICGLTGNYTLPDSVYGMMAAFYYWVPGPCPALGVTTLAALIALVAALVLSILTVAKDLHQLDLPAAVLSVISAALMIAGFVLAKSMEPDMIAGYCSGNPACSLRSYALVPAIVAVAVAVICILAAVKLSQAKNKLAS